MKHRICFQPIATNAAYFAEFDHASERMSKDSNGILILSGHGMRRSSIGVPSELSIEGFVPTELRHKSLEDLFEEQVSPFST